MDFQRIEEVFILRTVIETDSDVALPSAVKPEATYRTAATLKPGSTPTPEPTAENPIWSYPTVTPEAPEMIYGNYKVGDIIEDTWATTTY